MEPATALLGVGEDHRPALTIIYEACQNTGSGTDLARTAALPLFGKLRLDHIPQVFGDDCFMLTFKRFALMKCHSAIYPVGQEMIKITPLEVDPAPSPAILTLLDFGEAVVPGQQVY